MSKVKNILRLLAAGVSKRQIADRTQSSRKTIDKYEDIFLRHPYDYAKLLQQSHKELLSIISPASEQKPSHIELYGLFPAMVDRLKKRGVTKQMLWEEYKEQYPDGVQISQFHEHFGRYAKSVNVSYVFEHKAADKLMVDFAGQKLYVADAETGELIAVQVFVGILPCSGLTFAMACLSQQTPDFLGCLSKCLYYIGGVPQAIVTDNLKPAVSKASKYDPELNPNMANFADHYGTTVLPTRAYRPKDKALAEGAVHLLYSRVYAHIDQKIYHSLAELNKDILSLVEKHNHSLYQKKEGSRRSQFEALEKGLLKPLPGEKFELKSHQDAKVQANCHVYLSEDKHYYSVPYSYVGKKIKIIYSKDVVEIYYNYERISTHPRMPAIGKYSTITAHLHPHHAYYKNWSVEYFMSQAEKIGKSATGFIEQLLLNGKHPEAGFKRCAGLLAYVKKYGPEKVELACKIGLQYDYASLKQIEYLLEKKDIESAMEPKDEAAISPHQNERGPSYYQ